MVDETTAGIKSIEVGARVLRALIEEPQLSVTTLAKKTRMTPGKVHRYLVSFMRSGLVCQDPATRHYALGPMAFQLGAAAMARSNELSRATVLQKEIRDAVDETVILSVWSSSGPTIIRVEESAQPVMMTMKLGAHLPLLGTAAGLIYAAYMPRVATRPFIDKELLRLKQDSEWLDSVLEDIQHSGLSIKTGHLQPGVGAIAAPLLNLQGNLFAVVAVVIRDEPESIDSVSKLLVEKTDTFNNWPMTAASTPPKRFCDDAPGRDATG